VGQGFREVLGMVVAAEPLAAPCGACRQFLVQFGGGDMLVRSLSPVAVAAYRQWTTAELLPDRFEF
jgi:cytidine deaminase